VDDLLKQTTSFRNIVEQADQLYAGRVDIRNVEKSVELLEKSNPDSPASFGAAWRLARAKFFLGQESSRREQTATFHREGIEAGRRAVRQGPERVEGHFWLGVNLALLAQHEGPINAIVHALQAKRELQRAVELDSTYHAAGPLRVLARLQHKLPRVLGGGRQVAVENYQKAIALVPDNTVTRIYFAELLFEMGDEAAGHRELVAVLKAPTDPEWTFERERDQEFARTMMRDHRL
jgi:tetratricopeptide (TPR) repeat protein